MSKVHGYCDVKFTTTVDTVHVDKLKVQGENVINHIVHDPIFYQFKEGAVYNRENKSMYQVILPNEEYIPIMSHKKDATIQYRNSNRNVYSNLYLENDVYYEKTRGKNEDGYVEWGLS